MYFKRPSVYSQQAHGRAVAPVLAEQGSDLLEDFGIELRGSRQAVRPGDGGEIYVAQLELESASMQLLFPQPPAHHFREPHQGRFQLIEVRRILVVGMFVADRLGADVGADLV